MRGLIATAILCAFAAAVPGQSAPDEAAVRTVVDHWRQAWEAHDPAILRDDFAEDADWLNAFGVRQKGRTQILGFVATVFKRPTLQNRQTTWEESKIRFVRPDVALAYRDYKTVGHKTMSGREMPERRTHATWVLTKSEGAWRIASQMISDEISGQ